MSNSSDKAALNELKARRAVIAKEMQALEKDKTLKGEARRKQLQQEDNLVWQKIDKIEYPGGPFYESEEEKGRVIRTNVQRLLGGLL